MVGSHEVEAQRGGLEADQEHVARAALLEAAHRSVTCRQRHRSVQPLELQPAPSPLIFLSYDTILQFLQDETMLVCYVLALLTEGTCGYLSKITRAGRVLLQDDTCWYLSEMKYDGVLGGRVS